MLPRYSFPSNLPFCTPHPPVFIRFKPSILYSPSPVIHSLKTFPFVLPILRYSFPSNLPFCTPHPPVFIAFKPSFLYSPSPGFHCLQTFLFVLPIPRYVLPSNLPFGIPIFRYSFPSNLTICTPHPPVFIPFNSLQFPSIPFNSLQFSFFSLFFFFPSETKLFRIHPLFLFSYIPKFLMFLSILLIAIFSSIFFF